MLRFDSYMTSQCYAGRTVKLYWTRPTEAKKDQRTIFLCVWPDYWTPMFYGGSELFLPCIMNVQLDKKYTANKKHIGIGRSVKNLNLFHLKRRILL